MFEHVVNSVYIPADDVISHRLDEFWRAVCRFMILYGRLGKAVLDTRTHSATVVVRLCKDHIHQRYSGIIYWHFVFGLVFLIALSPLGSRGGTQ